jgi:hypothetical protein
LADVRSYVASGSTAATTSRQRRSRPACIGTSTPVRSKTKTVVTLGSERKASSAMPFMSTGLLRRSTPSTVSNAFAPASPSRDASASGP